jgi:type I restriction-modification system DNA methylase subunit
MFTFTQKCLFCIMPLFQESIIKKFLSAIDDQIIEKAFREFKLVYSPEKIKNIKTAKEEQYQEGFIKDIFGQVLGYSVFPEQPFNIQTEKKNQADSKKADGAIFQGENVVGVIELKDNKTKNLDVVKDQAFGYKNNHKDCSYVITSNFHKLRFYVDDATEYEEFDLYNLDKETFKRFYLYLRKEGLLDKNIPKLLRQETKFHEENITKSLYKDYSSFKYSFFKNVVKNNPQHDRLLLFKKSQKFLDKVLFVLFAEDKGLVTTNSIVHIVEKWQDLKNDAFDTAKPLYQLVSLFFNNLFVGKKDQNGSVLIPEFGGEIFAPDEVLDTLIVDDGVLKDDLLKLSRYDFNTDVDVNILGHIFEHSLSEIEEIEAELKGQVSDKIKGKRKKDGVFYTPKYITKYIVESTLGEFCLEKKLELKLDVDIDILELQRFDGKLNAKGLALYKALNIYKSWLLSLKILDPACGSGAFLNQVLNFLVEEHKFVDDLIADLTDTPLRLFNTDLAILENNIYGVDINEESIEIAKLSLWLRTAKQDRKLFNLNNNIKCGNSLIDDSSIAGDKAFNWKNEFPEVFANGGFDIVIGNPPYVDIKNIQPEIVRELFRLYSTSENRINLYSIFIERGFQILKSKGFLSYINPNSILVNSSYTKIRKKLINDVTTIIKLPDNIFEDAKVETIIFELRKGSNSNKCNTLVYKKDDCITSIDKSRFQTILKKDWMNSDSFIFNIYTSNQQAEVLSIIVKNTVHLSEIADFSLGITPYDKYKGHSTDLINSRGFHSSSKLNENYKPLISGSNIIRFCVFPKVNEFINYGDWLGAPREERFFTAPRIIVRQIVSGNPPRIYAGFTEEPLYFTQLGFGIIPKENKISVITLLCLMNSKLINYFHKYSFLDLEKELFQKILIANCKKFPINKNILSNPDILDTYGYNLISKINELYKIENSFLTFLNSRLNINTPSRKLSSWTSINAKEFLLELRKSCVSLSLKDESEWIDYFNDQKQKAISIKSNCDQIENEINKLIYQLYNLTKDEIRIIESD